MPDSNSTDDRNEEGGQSANKNKEDSCESKEQHVKFFSKRFFQGIILLLVSYVVMDIEKVIIYEKIKYAVEILKNLSGPLGTAIIIAAIFNYTIESKDFIEYMKKILTQIVISKDFLRRLDGDDKKEILKTILTPSADQVKIYSNINEYFKLYINESVNLFNTNFKSDLHINVYACIDEKRVNFEETITYRVYKVREKFEPITVGFQSNDDYEIIETLIIAPDGTREVIDDKKGHLRNEESGFFWKEHSYDLILNSGSISM